MDGSDENGAGRSIISIKVSHGLKLNQHEVAVPSNSTFGDVKSAVAQKIGLENPDSHKLFFRGKEREDGDDLRAAGVKHNAKLLLLENPPSKRKSPENVAEEANVVVSRGHAAVARVREEVDKLSQQVEALQAVIESGTKIDEKDIVYLTEMLMREMLKLDTIEAEGEGKVQRKSEVRRIQGYVETMDILKSKNSDISTDANNSNNPNPVPVTSQRETFDDGVEIEITNAPSTRSSPVLDSSSNQQSPAETNDVFQPSLAQNSPTSSPSLSAPDVEPISAPPPSSSPSSTTKVKQEWEHFD